MFDCHLIAGFRVNIIFQAISDLGIKIITPSANVYQACFYINTAF